MRRQEFSRIEFIDELLAYVINPDDCDHEAALKRCGIKEEDLDDVREDTLYVVGPDRNYVEYKCPCGCGNTVFLNTEEGSPHPVWGLEIKDGKLSLYPSVFSVSWKCKSHYFIKDNKVIWC